MIERRDDATNGSGGDAKEAEGSAAKEAEAPAAAEAATEVSLRRNATRAIVAKEAEATMKSSTMKSSMKKSSIEQVVAPVPAPARVRLRRGTIGRARVGTTASPSTLPFAVRVFDGLFALKFESVSRSSDSKIRSSDSKIRSTRVWRDGTSIAIDVLCRRGLVVVRSAGLSSFGVAGPAGRGTLARAGRTRVDRDGGARIARLVVSARLASRARRLDPSGRFPFLLVLARRRSSRGGVRQVRSSRRRAPSRPSRKRWWRPFVAAEA